ncbi:SGNH/GDSL hydrolase family protein [Streptomyces sp. B3I8]|uniref:SGNH/GDSL hydrolase family protein n=1 Tax=Streptomyces sp. B3I8 TaxID=3042303 RepID=UPI0027811122|nr:SGNH/GDSL hydrolase family protein [Streptomyces sp. B3I8]MDQ0791370.1 lysophospholipase L1-like esterase [Streptomyces sp. B3I8]
MRRCATLLALLLTTAGLSSTATALPATATSAAPPSAAAAAPSSAAAERGSWTGTWAAAASGTASDTGYAGYTLRNLVRTSVGGDRIRVKLSNALGTRPVLFAHTTVGLQKVPDSAALAPGSLRDLTFDGHRAVTVPAGAEVYSDPVALPVAAAADLFVTTYTPDPSGPVTLHAAGLTTSYYATDGTDHAGDLGGAGLPSTTQSWHYVTEVDVRPGRPEAATGSGAVVALGDSITDGIASTPGTDRRWPDRLAARLRASHGPARGFGVLNAGISGNRVLHEGTGPSARDRLDRDVLRRAGARTVIVLEGINDIQRIPGEGSADEIVTGLRDIADRAHAAGLRVLGGTLIPFEGWQTYGPEQEAARETVNTWIRDGGVVDAVVDFDAAVRDPADPHRMRTEYDSGDHLHPNDEGLRAMADAVDLDALGRPDPARLAPYLRPVRSLTLAAAPGRAVTIAGRAATVPFVTRTTVQGPGTVRGKVTASLDGKRYAHPFAVRSDGRFAQVDVALDVPVPAALAAGEHHVRFTVRTRDGRSRTATAVLDVRGLGCAQSDDSCPVDLTGAYDRDSIASADHPDDGDFDGLGWSYAAETLPANGPSVLAGAPFAFPSSADGTKNTVTAQGQTLELPGLRARQLRVLGAASGGAAEGTATLTYADGSTAAVSLGFSDWAGQPQPGETVAVAAPYRYRAGTGRDGPAVRIFARTLPLDPDRVLRSVRLPDDTRLKLFAATVDQSG